MRWPTGNNQDYNTELYAIARNPNLGRMGDHYSEDYRRARLTHSQTNHMDNSYWWSTGGGRGSDGSEDDDEDFRGRGR